MLDNMKLLKYSSPMNKSVFSLTSDLLLNKDTENFLNVKRVKLLENIVVYGSIAKAAKASGVTYKTAWEWIDKMNDLSPKPLVKKISGGKGGGGTVVTAYAKELMHLFEEIEALHQKHLNTLEESFSYLENEEEVGSFSFSRLEGKIIEIVLNAKNAIVSIELLNGSVISAQAPISFVEVNALKVGSVIMALIESDAISVSRSFDKEISSRNKLKTEVIGISIEEDVLLTLGLDEAQMMTSRITLKSYNDLKIKKGDILIAMFKAYSVTLFNVER